MILPPVFERSRERDEQTRRRSLTPARRAYATAYRKQHFPAFLEGRETLERLRAQAEQRERFHAYRAANPPPRANGA